MFQKKKIILILILLVSCTIFVSKKQFAYKTFAQELNSEKIYCTATIEDDFDDNSIIITLFPEYSQYFGVKQEVSRDLLNLELNSIRELNSLPSEYINADGSINAQIAPGIAAHYRTIEFEQILCIEIKNSGKQNVLDKIKQIEELDYVRCANPNYYIQSDSNDSSLTSSNYTTTQWAFTQQSGINFSQGQANNITIPSFVRVGILDTGIANHTDLNVDRQSGAYFAENGDLDNTASTLDTSNDGHGTKVAGIINLIANGVTLVPLKRANEFSALISAINYATSLWDTDKRISIINCSLAGGSEYNDFLSAIMSFPGLFVWAAGNDGEQLDMSNENQLINHYYSKPNLIIVGAITKTGGRSIWTSHSSSNPSSNYGNRVNIYAPGGGADNYSNYDSIPYDDKYIVSTSNVNDGYDYFNGTSAAAPFVSGVAALMLSKNISLSASEIKEIILSNGDNITIKGVVSKRLNASAAINAVPASNFTISENGALTNYTLPTDFDGHLEIPFGVKSINSNVFAENEEIISVTIPGSVTSIAQGAFSNCNSLFLIYLLSPNLVNLSSSSVFNNSPIEYIVVPGNLLSNYSGNAGWSTYGSCFCKDLADCFEINQLGCITGYSNTVTESRVIVPKYVGGIKVKSISGGTFYNRDEITTIVFHSGIIEIANVTEGCDNIESIVIPFVGRQKNGTANTHLGCIFGDSTYNATSTNIPPSLKTVKILGGTISSNAFYNTTNIESLYIGNGVTSIVSDAFFNCSGLTSITVNESNTVYKSEGNCLIRTSDNLLVLGCKNSVIPNYVTSIGEYAFAGNTKIYSITIPNNIVSIGQKAFKGCTNISSITASYALLTSLGRVDEFFINIFGTGDVRMIKRVEITNASVIGYNAFSGCSYLEEIVLPSTLTQIGSNAFAGCSGLEEITLPDGLLSIGTGAFLNCSGLTGIIIPASVEEIITEAFWGCTNLEWVQLKSDEEIDIEVAAFGLINSYTNEQLGCPNLLEICVATEALETAYRADPDLDHISDIIYCRTPRLQYTLIDYGTDGGYEVSVGNSITSIYMDIVIPATYNGLPVVKIADYGFYDLYELENVIILGTNLVTIGRYAFAESNYLKKINIPNSVMYIEEYAFMGCRQLNSINLSSTLVSIGYKAFEYCADRITFTVSDWILMVDYGAFNGKYTIFAEVESWEVCGWNLEQMPNCTIFWNCELGDEETYVISIGEDNHIISQTYWVAEPYREGYEFMGWTTVENSTVVEYSMLDLYQGEFMYGEDLKLYAVWEPIVIDD